MPKLVFVLQLREDLPREAGLSHWRNEHGVLARKTPGLTRYTQLHSLSALQGDLKFDGIAELEFSSSESFEAAMASPEWQATLADASTFADLERTWTAMAEDVQIL